MYNKHLVNSIYAYRFDYFQIIDKNLIVSCSDIRYFITSKKYSIYTLLCQYYVFICILHL